MVKSVLGESLGRLNNFSWDFAIFILFDLGTINEGEKFHCVL